jgi:hypothetical protein
MKSNPKAQIAKVPQPKHSEPPNAALMEKALTGQDLAGLSPEQRLSYYKAVCESLKLNPLTKPFDFISLDGKTVLYARKDCTEQLRRRDTISVRLLSRETSGGCYIVTAQASLPNGRVDESIGIVPVVHPDKYKVWNDAEQKNAWKDHPKAGQPLTGADLANAMMKAETKAKRRVTLSIAGLGIMDESEIEHGEHTPFENETIPAASQQPQKTLAARLFDRNTTLAELEVIRDEYLAKKESVPHEILGLIADMKLVASGDIERAELEKYYSQTAPVVTPIVPGTVSWPVIETKNDVRVDNWRLVVCHIGKANGPMLGKMLGEVHPKIITWLKEKWIEGDSPNSYPANPSEADKTLKTAVLAALKDLAASGTPPEPAKEAQQPKETQAAPEPKPEQAQKPEPPIIEAETEVTPVAANDDWRKAKVPFPCKIQNKTLSELAPDFFCAIKTQLIDKRNWETETVEHKKFKALYELAAEDTGYLLSAETLRAKIREWFDDMVLTEEDAIAFLVQQGILETEEGYAGISEALLLHIWQNRKTLKEIHREASQPKAQPKPKKGK